MGKKKEPRYTAFDYMKGGRIEKMGERYGVDKSDYNITGDRNDGGTGRTYKGGKEEYEAAIAKAAMNDYDTRRTMEAQAMSGKKKARKYAEEGFGNITDVIKANNMRERWHKNAGNGGSFSSASDFAGQTMRAVERERRLHDQDIDSRISAMSASQQAEEADKGFTYEGDDVEISPEMQAAKDRVAAWEGGTAGGGSTSPYGGSAFSDAASEVYGGGADDQQSQASVVADSTDGAAADSYLGAFKEKMKKQRNFKRDF